MKLKKLIWCGTALLLLNVIAFSESDFPIAGSYVIVPDIYWDFTSTTLTTTTYIMDSELVKRYEYSTEYSETLPFIIIQDYSPHKFLALPSQNKNALFLYAGDNKEPENGGLCDIEFLVFNWDQYTVSASSSYSDSQDAFPAENITDKKLYNPWVEGVPGDGTGEYLLITRNTAGGDSAGITGILFANGFVSYDKPYLYEYNNRVKKIIISSPESGRSAEFDIPDSPFPVFLDFGFSCVSLKIEIAGTYPGTRWDDTCINFIMPVIDN